MVAARDTILSVRLKPAEREELNQLAEDLDIAPSALVRLWALEKLRSLRD